MATNITDIVMRFVVDNQLAIKNTREYQQTQKELSKDIQNNTVVYVQNTKAVNDYEKAVIVTDSSVKKFSKSTQDSTKFQINWNEVIKTSSSVTSDFVSALANIIGNFGVIGFIRESSSALFDFGKNITIAATATTALTTYLSNDFVNAFKSVNSEMANVNSILLETPANIENLTDKVADLSTSFKLATQTQIAQGLYDVASAGLTGADGLTVMDSAVKASVAGLTDVRTAATPLVQVLNATGQSASNSEQIMNSMFSTVQRGVLTFRDYANGIGRVIGTAQSMSVSLATLNGGIALLTKMGSMPEAAFTNMNSLLLSFAAMSETAKKKAKDLGIEMDANAIKAKGFETVVNEMVKAAEKTGDLNGTLFTLLGRQEALDAAIKLSTQSGELFRKEVQANINSNTALNNSLEKQSKAYEMQEKAISVGMNNIKVSIGQVVASWIGSLFPSIQGVIDYFNNLDKTSKTVIISLGFIPPIIGVLVTAFGLATFGLVAFAAQLTLSSVALNIIRTNLGVVTTFLNTFAGGALTATRSMWGFTTSTTAGNTAVTGLRATLMTTIGTLAGFFAVFTAGAGAIALVTKKVLDMRTAFKEEIELEQQQMEQANKNAKRLRELREKENQLKKEGKQLTSAEYQEQSRLITAVSGVNVITRKSATERIELSKKRLKEEEELAKKEKGLTDEQLKTRKEFLDKIRDAEIKASKDKYIQAVNDAKKNKEDLLKELDTNLKLGLIKENESLNIKKSINNSYNLALKQAAEDRDKEILQKQKEATDKYIQDINRRYKLPLIKSEQKILDIESSNLDNEEKVKKVNKELEAQKSIYDIKKSFFQKDTEAYTENEIKIKEIQRRITKNNIDIAKEKLDKEREIASKVQKINEEISQYVIEETKKKSDAEKKLQEDLLEKNTKLREDLLEKNTKLREDGLKHGLKLLGIRQEALKQAIDLEFKDDLEAQKSKREQAEISYKLEKITLAERDKLIQDSYDQEESIYLTIANMFNLSEEQKTEFLKKAKEARDNLNLDSFLKAKQLREYEKKLNNSLYTSLIQNTGLLTDKTNNLLQSISTNFDLTSGKMISKTADLGNAVDLVSDSAIKMSNTFSKAFKNGIKDVESFNDFLSGILDSVTMGLGKKLVSILGFDVRTLEEKIQDFQGKLSEITGIVSGSVKKYSEEVNQIEQSRIDLIDDEMLRRSEQLKYDIKIIEKEISNEQLKNNKIAKLTQDFNKWKQEQQSKEVTSVDDSGKKIQEINEKNYKSELSIIDEVYGKKRKKLESEVQKEIDIIQSKNDRIKAIEDERTQSDTDKQKRLQSFNQSLSSNQRSADFYRANEQDFEFGFNGNSNERKKIEADYNAGVINYETYAKKRTEIALKQYQYYNEQAKRISDPKAKQEALDKATQGQEEYYNFIFDKEKEKVENETKQAEKRLVLKQQELATVTELEKSEIAKLDQAYKDSSGMYRDTFVEATQVWTKFAQESINNIDLSNLINKVKNDVAQAKAELNGIKASVNSTVQQAKTTISNTTTVNNAPTAPTQTPVNTSTPSKPLSGVSKGISSVANGISNAASSIAKGISNAAIPYGPTAPDWYGKYTFATNPTETTVKAPDNIGVSDYELKRRKQHDDQAKINNILAKLLKQANWNVSFDNYANQSLSWFEDQARQFGIPLMAKGGVTNGISIAGERGSEAIFNYSDMKSMYDFVKNTAINPSNNYSNQASININYSPVFTGIDLSKTGQVDAMIKNNMNTLKNDILKAQAGR